MALYYTIDTLIFCKYQLQKNLSPFSAMRIPEPSDWPL